MDPDYHPIACKFYDQLEAFATTRRRVRLALKSNPSAAEGRTEGLITDIYTNGRKEEFLRLDDGTEIRLDRIRGVYPASAV